MIIYNELLKKIVTSKKLLWLNWLYKSKFIIHNSVGPLWPWSYCSWIYNYLCNQCLSPLMLWVRISIRVRCTTLCDKDCQWLAIGRWFSPGPPVSSTNTTDCHDITEILLKVEISTIDQRKQCLYWKKTNVFFYN